MEKDDEPISPDEVEPANYHYADRRFAEDIKKLEEEIQAKDEIVREDLPFDESLVFLFDLWEFKSGDELKKCKLDEYGWEERLQKVLKKKHQTPPG